MSHLAAVGCVENPFTLFRMGHKTALNKHGGHGRITEDGETRAPHATIFSREAPGEGFLNLIREQHIFLVKTITIETACARALAPSIGRAGSRRREAKNLGSFYLVAGALRGVEVQADE